MLFASNFRSIGLFLVCLPVVVFAAPAPADTVSGFFDSGLLTVRGSDFVTTSVPFSGGSSNASATVSNSGTGITASAVYSYTNNASGATFAVNNLNYSLTQGSFAEYFDSITFNPTSNVTYALAGTMHFGGIFGSPTLSVQLGDQATPGVFIVNDFPHASGTNNKTLNLPSSDPSNPLTGTLLSGHTYVLTYDIGNDTNQSFNPGTGTTTASASLTLTPQGVVVVPLPSSLLGGLVLFAGLIVLKHRWAAV